MKPLDLVVAVIAFASGIYCTYLAIDIVECRGRDGVVVSAPLGYVCLDKEALKK